MKEFKTIMIRGLDEPENKPLVEIMNSVIQRHESINTGQAVIEFIIKDWDKTKKELMHQIRFHNEYETKTTSEITTLKQTIEEYRTKIFNFQTALKALTTIK